MSDDLFARAKGPRREITHPEEFPCPWCGADCLDHAGEENPVTACPDCGKEFLCPDERGELVCVGLISPADAKYLALRSLSQSSPAEEV